MVSSSYEVTRRSFLDTPGSPELSSAETPGAPTSAPPPGTLLDRYLVIDESGQDGAGVLLRAYDPRLQRELTLRVTAAVSAEAQNGILRAAQSMAKLSHPNVLAIYDAAVIGDQVVTAMEYARGATLDVWLAQPRAPSEIIELFIAAGRGLAAAHAADLIHGGFEASCVLVGDDGRVRVRSFLGTEDAAAGLAGADTDSRMAGARTPAGDQYAFCCALWEALTQQRLEDAGEPLRWPREVVLPTTSQAAILRGLAAEAGERWLTMEALLEVLAADTKPRFGTRPWTVTTLVAATASLLVGAAASYQQRLAERCTGARLQLTDVWDEARRQAAHGAMEATSISYVGDVWERVAPRLDDYAAAWADMHTQACAATTVHGEQSPEVMDLRMACLHRAKVDLRAVTDLLVRADTQVVEHAHQLLNNLPPLSRCADVEALKAGVAPPGPAEQEAVENIRVEVAEVKALRLTGKYVDALARMQPVAERAQGISYAPLRIEVMTELGQALENSDAYTEAEAAFKQAFRTALASTQWMEAAQSAVNLLQITGARQMRTVEGLAYAETARALLEHSDTEGAARALFHNQLAYVLERLGKYAEAEAEHRAAVEVALSVPAISSAEVAQYRIGLGAVLTLQERVPEAEAELRTAMTALEAALGPEHPAVASVRFELATVLHLQSRFTESEAAFRATLEAWKKAFGADKLYVSIARAGLGSALQAQGRLEEAVAEFTAALAVQRKILGPEHVNAAIVQTNLAGALAKQGRSTEAVALAKPALAIAEKSYGAKNAQTSQVRLVLIASLLGDEQYAEAESHARQVLTAYEEAQDVDNRRLPQAHYYLGRALDGQDRHVEAEAALRTALRLQLDLVGEQGPHVTDFRRELESVIEARKRNEEAPAELQASLAATRTRGG